MSLPEMQRRRALWRRRWASQFGTGSQSRVLYGDPWAMAYRIGPHRELLGRLVSSLRVAREDAITAEVANASLVRQVTAGDGMFPTRVTGPLHGVPFGEHRDVAVAVNGRIQAVGRSFDLWWKGREYFSVMVPESSMHLGRNRIGVFEVRADGALVPLQRL
jgi:hypothetical protein